MSNVIYDAKLSVDQKQASLGTIIYQNLKSKNEEKIMQVDAITGESIKVKNLLEWSVNLACSLRKLNVKKNDIMAIVSENDLKYFLPIISAFYIGVAVNCVNPSYTENELQHSFLISKPKVVFTSKSNLQKIINLKETISFIEHIVVLNADKENTDGININSLIVNDGSTFQIEDDVNPKETLALILLSSGTTGLPKCVMLTHENIRLALNYISDPNVLNMNKNTVTIGLLPYFHMFGILISLGALMFDSKLIQMIKFKPDVYLQTIEDYKVTVLFLVPPLLLFFAKSPIVKNYNLNSVREIMCGAAPIGKDIEKLVEERLNINIRQMYGLTEATGIMTISPRKEIKKYGSAGTAVNGYNIKICDLTTGKFLGHNESGEICVKSLLVMKGYMGNIEETHNIIDADGYLHTGDLGYYDEDGFFFIIDRIKEIIKYKGFQVAPAELEDLLLKHESVKDVAVVGKLDERVGELPLAFVVAQPNSQVTKQQLINYVAENISDEKHLRGGIIFTSEIPKNASGKILRRLLRDKL